MEIPKLPKKYLPPHVCQQGLQGSAANTRSWNVFSTRVKQTRETGLNRIITEVDKFIIKKVYLAAANYLGQQ